MAESAPNDACRQLLDSLPQLLWLADSSGVPIFFNSAWETNTGTSPVSLDRDAVRRLVHPDDRDMLARLDPGSRSPDEGGVFLRLNTSAGYRWHIGRVRDLPGDFPHAARSITTLDDIHESRLIEDLLRRHRDALGRTTEALEQSRSELESFSYAISHDLRTPLRAIEGFTLALEEDHSAQLDSTARGHLERIRSGAARMSRMIEALFAFSRLSRDSIRHSPIDVASLARSVWSSITANDPDRREELLVDAGVRVIADEGLMTIVLENLLGNAYKFTRMQASPRVEIARVEGRSGFDCFALRDNGVGFDMRLADRLFAPFQRLHPDEDFEGTGIGLALVHRIVVRHGGEVSGRGSPGSGAEFILCFPEKPANDSLFDDEPG